MFGTYRFVLATLVVLNHLWPQLSNWNGIFAVFGFYLLSGYLMTSSLHSTYGFSRQGLGAYALNRVLRIYPPYIFVLTLSALAVALSPATADRLNVALVMPSDITEWLRNVTIFGLNYDRARLIPPAWSLDVEITFYALMAIGLSRSKSVCLLWFAASAVVTTCLLISKQPFSVRYYSVLGASLPFGMGATIYFFRDSLSKLRSAHVILSALVFLIVVVGARHFFNNPKEQGFYFSLAASAYLQVALMSLGNGQVPRWVADLDVSLGSLSYPIFLCHWTMAIAISAWLDIPKGYQLFALGFVGSIALAYILNTSIERPVDKLRRAIKMRLEEAGKHVRCQQR